MLDRNIVKLYDQTAVWARLVAWLLVGTAGFVLVPLALIYRAWWLLILAVPLLLAGLVLFMTRLRIVLDRRTGSLQVSNYLLGLRMKERTYSHSDTPTPYVQRVAGAKRERPSDTWYLRLQFRDQTHTIGRFDDRITALQAQERLEDLLSDRRAPPTPDEMRSAAEDRLHDQPESAEAHYQLGLALMRSGQAAEAQGAFERAGRLAEEPLLRRMIEQRLKELRGR
jgi:hypothetical protein